ncbi:MAG: T9SS type A sorting domain-containing protein [bacterium]|nr:T9SS type A sorting domain-containing protein [bacterium]
MKFVLVFFVLILLFLPSYSQPSITPVIVPLYQTRGNLRVPSVFRVTLNGLNANATYRFYNRSVNAVNDGATSNGIGNPIFCNASGFFSTTTPSLSTSGTYDSFTTNASGSATIWMALETNTNQRYNAGRGIAHRVMLNNGAGGTSVATRLTTIGGTDSIRNLIFGTSTVPSNYNGTGLRGVLPPTGSGSARDFIFFYNNVSGTGRPLVGTYIESEGYANGNSPPTFYTNFVQGVNRAFGTCVPNFDTIRRVEVRSFTNGSIIRYFKDADGLWPGGANLRSPNGGNNTIRVLTSVDFATSLQVTSGGTIPNGGTKNFGTQLVGSYTNITFTITNTSPGNSPLTFNSITGPHASNFTYIGTTPTVIDGFDGVNTASVTFTVRFTPSATGLRTASLSFTSLDTTSSTFTINLTGIGESYSTGVTRSGSGTWTPSFPLDPNTDNKRPADMTFTGSDTPDSARVSYASIAPIPYLNPFPYGVKRIWNIVQYGGTNWTTNLVLRFTPTQDPYNNRFTPLNIARSTDGGLTWVMYDTNLTAVQNGNAWEVTIPNVTEFSYWAMGNGPILPVELTNFIANSVYRGVSLQWTTVSEIHNLGFSILRQEVGNTANFHTYFVPSLAESGNSTTELTYHFLDRENLVSGTIYEYHLYEVDIDGSQRLLRSVQVHYHEKTLPTAFGLLEVYPNPFNSTTKVKVLVGEPSFTTVALYNLQGQLVKNIYSGHLDSEEVEFTIDGTTLSSGVYMLRASRNGIATQQKVVLLR